MFAGQLAWEKQKNTKQNKATTKTKRKKKKTPEVITLKEKDYFLFKSS